MANRGSSDAGGATPVALEWVECNLCGSDRNKEVFRKRDERFPGCEFEFPVVECEDCGLAFVNPRPTLEAMQGFYPPGFYEHRDGTKSSRRYEAEMAQIASGPGKLLDVGCANGDFVLYAKERGFDAEGLEISAHAGNPYGLTIHRSFESLPEGSYDVVTSWAVFEHLHDPATYFREIHRILRPGGEFVFLVPNFSSYRSRTMMCEDVPRHLVFFTPETVARYLSAVGMALRRVVQDNSIYYGGHRKFLVCLALRMLGRSFRGVHMGNPWDLYRRGLIPLGELLLLSPIDHVDRLFHRWVTEWFARRGRNGIMVVHAAKPS